MCPLVLAFAQAFAASHGCSECRVLLAGPPTRTRKDQVVPFSDIAIVPLPAQEEKRNHTPGDSNTLASLSWGDAEDEDLVSLWSAADSLLCSEASDDDEEEEEHGQPLFGCVMEVGDRFDSLFPCGGDPDSEEDPHRCDLPRPPHSPEASTTSVASGLAPAPAPSATKAAMPPRPSRNVVRLEAPREWRPPMSSEARVVLVALHFMSQVSPWSPLRRMASVYCSETLCCAAIPWAKSSWTRCPPLARSWPNFSRIRPRRAREHFRNGRLH